MEERKRILSVGAHIGDAELAQGGALSTLRMKGYDTLVISVCEGKLPRSRKYREEGAKLAYRAERLRQWDAFHKEAGGRHLLLLPEPTLPPDADEKLSHRLAKLIREEKPYMIFTHWEKSIDPEHERVYKMVHRAITLASDPAIRLDGLPHYAPLGLYSAECYEDHYYFTPNLYVEVTEAGFENWKNGMKVFPVCAAVKGAGGAAFYAKLMNYRGLQTGTQYAAACRKESAPSADGKKPEELLF